MARVMVRTARKQYKCGNCGDTIAIGQRYQWAKPGFRARTKLIRCLKPTCHFRPSQLTTSKMSQAYSALEDATSQLESVTTLDEIQSIMDDAANSLIELAGEYEEADSNFGGGGNTDMAEKAEVLNQAAEELSDWQSEGDAGEPCDEHEENQEDCEVCAQLQTEFILEQAQTAKELIEGLSL